MPCMLRIWGKYLDIDALIGKAALSPEFVWKAGGSTLVSGRNSSRPQGAGASYLVSNAGLADFDTQRSDSVDFMKRYEAELKVVLSFPGVEGAVLDFGIWRRDVAAQYDYFPPELIRLAGELGLGIELSQYTASDEVNDIE